MENKPFKSATRAAGRIETSGREITRFSNMSAVETLTKKSKEISFEAVKNHELASSPKEVVVYSDENSKKSESLSGQLMAIQYSSDESDQEEADNKADIVYPFEHDQKPTSRETHFEIDLNFYESVVNNVVAFIKTPGPRNQMVKCKILIRRILMVNEFVFYLEYPNGSCLQLMKSNRKVDIFSIFWINVCVQNYLVRFGKLQSNLARNSYFLIGDLKENPEQDTSFNKKYLDLDFIKSKGKPKPKELKAEILLLEEAADDERRRSSSLARMFEKKVNKRVSLVTRKAYFDESVKKYRLEFDGRALKASANNFQLVDSQDNKIFQIGKLKTNYYNVDFTYPMCAFEAFGIAMACLSRKWI